MYVFSFMRLVVTGINWDQSKLGRYPDRKDLDNLQLNKPVEQ